MNKKMTTKEKILKSALKLFAKKGVDKTSTREITEDVGIAESTLFKHFKTKQELIDTLYIAIKENITAKLWEILDDKQSVETNIKQMSKLVIDHLINNYSELVFMEIMEKSPQLGTRAVDDYKKIYKESAKLIKKWVKAGELKKVNHDLIHETIWNLIVVIAKHCKASKIKEVDESMMDLVWDSVKA